MSFVVLLFMWGGGKNSNCHISIKRTSSSFYSQWNENNNSWKLKLLFLSPNKFLSRILFYFVNGIWDLLAFCSSGVNVAECWRNHYNRRWPWKYGRSALDLLDRHNLTHRQLYIDRHFMKLLEEYYRMYPFGQLKANHPERSQYTIKTWSKFLFIFLFFFAGGGGGYRQCSIVYHFYEILR